jgi:predicted N-acetyltransferase YhbS
LCPKIPDLHAEAIEDLFDGTFGPGHFAKTAERLREYSHSLPEINRVAVLDGQVIAVCRVWPLVVGPVPGPGACSTGRSPWPRLTGAAALGLTVTGEALEAGKAAGWPAAILIGAPSLFRRDRLHGDAGEPAELSQARRTRRASW